MALHRGAIVETAIRKSGYTITEVSERLGISRNTLYSKFKKPNLNYHFVTSVGQAIQYDFFNDFPEIGRMDLGANKQDNVINMHTDALARLEQQFTRLLKVYHRLLNALVSMSDDNELVVLKQEIAQLMEEGIES